MAGCIRREGRILKKVFIETTGFEGMITDALKKKNIPAESISVHCRSKEERLIEASLPIQNGTVEFPETGAELLISQVLNLGAEKHDDLADALTMLVTHTLSRLCEPLNGMLQIAMEGLESAKEKPNEVGMPKGLNDWVALASQQRGLW